MKLSDSTKNYLGQWITVSNFKGVPKFYDVSGLFANGEALQGAIHALHDLSGDLVYDLIAGPEARGFVLSGALACREEKGCVMLRKAGRLPNAAASADYGTEYSHDHLEIGAGTVKPGQKVLITDDLLATGGTPLAAAMLIESLGGIVVGIIPLIELVGMGGRELLEKHGYLVRSVLQYEAEPPQTNVMEPMVTKTSGANGI